jgi:hypothetical protein
MNTTVFQRRSRAGDDERKPLGQPVVAVGHLVGAAVHVIGRVGGDERERWQVAGGEVVGECPALDPAQSGDVHELQKG